MCLNASRFWWKHLPNVFLNRLTRLVQTLSFTQSGLSWPLMRIFLILWEKDSEGERWEKCFTSYMVYALALCLCLFKISLVESNMRSSRGSSERQNAHVTLGCSNQTGFEVPAVLTILKQHKTKWSVSATFTIIELEAMTLTICYVVEQINDQVKFKSIRMLSVNPKKSNHWKACCNQTVDDPLTSIVCSLSINGFEDAKEAIIMIFELIFLLDKLLGSNWLHVIWIT